MSENTTTVPEGYVTSEELIARGIGADAQRRGRHGGDLPYAVVGTGFCYRQADVDSWLRGEIETSKTSKKAIDRYAAAKRAATAGRQDAPTGSAKTAWRAAVERLTASGMNPRDAIAAVDAEQPGLRMEMLREHNHR